MKFAENKRRMLQMLNQPARVNNVERIVSKRQGVHVTANAEVYGRVLADAIESIETHDLIVVCVRSPCGGKLPGRATGVQNPFVLANETSKALLKFFFR